MKKFMKLFGVLVVFAMIIAPIGSAFAKSGGFSSGGSRSRFSSSSSRSSGGFSSSKSSTPSVSKPSTSGGFSSGSSTVSKPASSGGFFSGKSSTTVAPTSKTTMAKPDAAAVAKSSALNMNQSSKSFATYSKPKMTYTPSQAPVMNSVRASGGNTYNKTVYVNRTNTFYRQHNWNPPVYVHMSPSYGIWNTMSLWFMLDHINDQQYAMMYYSHRNDDDMRRWRMEAEREAATNADLRAKLAAMDQTSTTMQTQNVKVDPSYVAPDMKDLAIAPEALETGHSGWFYFFTIMVSLLMVWLIIWLIFFKRW